MRILEITLTQGGSQAWRAVAELTEPEEDAPIRHEGLLQLTSEQLCQLRAAQSDPRSYGILLGQALFDGEVCQLLDTARARSQNDLHVLLVVEAPELRSLHWEWLCAPVRLGRQWDFLELDQRVLFCQHLARQADRRYPPVGRADLRALALVASPPERSDYGLEPFDAGAAVAGLKAAFGPIPHTILANAPAGDAPPTLDELCARITGQSYTLLHIVAHGGYRAGVGESVLFLLDAAGQVAPVTTAGLLERLDQVQGRNGLPRLVFLAACESASPEAEADGALGGMGQQLVRSLGVPAVVAMSARVSLDTAQLLAAGFYTRLREHGEVDRALAQAAAALASRGDIVVPALFTRLRGQPLFSDSLDREPTGGELCRGLERLANLLPERAPVLCAELDALRAELSPLLDTDPAALTEDAQARRQRALKSLNTLCSDMLEMSFNALAMGKEPPGYNAVCPFRGLYPFEERDRAFFFGRERLVQALARRLEAHPFLAILGPSGCGKSSLVMAGLIPRLGVCSLRFTPGADPLARLEAALAQASDPAAVVVADQFEELFTQCADEERRRAFLGRLLALPRRVVLTMRADFWGDCAPYGELREAMTAHQVLVAPLEPDQLQQVMQQQAAQVGLRFEADLADTIMADVRGEPGAMPLLQHALLELWKRRHGRLLAAVEYRERIGRVQRAIAVTAEDVYTNQLGPDERAQMRNLFIRLTNLGDEPAQGEERRDTRRRVALDELVPEGGDRAATKRLVDRLAGEQARLVVTSSSPVTGQEEVEVAHEALIRRWPRLSEWIDADRADIRLRERIRDAALEWREAAGSDDSLLVHSRGQRYEGAVRLMGRPGFLSALELEYVRASVELHEREAREEARRHQDQLDAAEARRRAEENARHVAERANKALRARLWVALALALLALLAAGGAAYGLEQARSARLAFLAQDLFNSQQFDRAVALALEANQQSLPFISPPEAAHRSLANVAYYAPGTQRMLAPEGGDVNSVAYAPDGLTALAGLEDGSLVLWDLEPGVAPRRLPGHRGPVTSVVFSPDGTRALSGSADGAALLWNLGRASLIRALDGEHSAGVTGVALSPDGSLALTGSADGTAILWDVETGEAVRRLPGNEGGVTTVAFSPDGSLAASGGMDELIHLWDTRTGELVRTLEWRNYEVSSMAFSPDGKQLLVGGRGWGLQLWDVASGAPLQSLEGHQGAANALAFSPKGRFVVSGSADGTLIVWDMARGEILRRLYGHTGAVNGLALSPDGSLLLSASSDGTLRQWDVFSAAQERIYTGSLFGTAALLPDGATALSGETVEGNGRLHRWRLDNGRVLRTIDHPGWVWSVAASPDGREALTGSTDTNVYLWDLGGGRLLRTLRGHSGRVNSVAFSPTERKALSGSYSSNPPSVDDRLLILWDLDTGQVIHHLVGHTAAVRSVVFSRDGRTALSGADDKTLILWDLDNGREIKRFTGHTNSVMSVAFSPDERTVLSGSLDTTMILWDVASGEGLRTFRGHTLEVSSVTFKPGDGETILSGSSDETLRLWDATTGGELARWQAHAGAVISAEYTPDGAQVLSAGRDSTLRLWRVDPPEDLVAWVRQNRYVPELTREERELYGLGWELYGLGW